VLAWSLPLTLGYLVAIPFAVATASQGLAELLKRYALCGIPEEFEKPAEIRALEEWAWRSLPALRRRSAARSRSIIATWRATGPWTRSTRASWSRAISPSISVALEPQPGPARAIRLIHGHDSGVTLVQAAAGDVEGEITLRVNSANPTVSTGSDSFVRAADGAEGWEGQVWDATIDVPCLTLDRLIREHGTPAFAKIDVEGFEDRVLMGLSRPIPALSFEFTTIARDVAERCLDRLSALGTYRFDMALGETQRLTFGRWISRDEMATHLAALPHEANSGDVYAVLNP
jgi:FkbM family methyltransferase